MMAWGFIAGIVLGSVVTWFFRGEIAKDELREALDRLLNDLPPQSTPIERAAARRRLRVLP